MTLASASDVLKRQRCSVKVTRWPMGSDTLTHRTEH
jgi:hypothetical protein